MSAALGIHQADIVIRSAIIAGLEDLRAHPDLLDKVFASLAEDQLTKTDYGEKEIEQAKKWFLSSDIPVFLNTRLDEAKFPCISIGLNESVEAEATLGDVHYVTEERTEGDWPAVTDPFAPSAYSASSGIMKIPASVLGNILLAPGMILIDRTGGEHLVLEVLDDDTVGIAAGTVADFSRTLLRSARPQYFTTLESLNFRETYSIGCHAQSEATYLTYLYSVVAFALLRYKEQLLEGRGFERSTISWSQFQRNENFENEVVYSRYCTITGYVRNYWPKSTHREVEAVTGPLSVSTPGAAGEEFTSDTGETTGDESWLADVDALLFET